MRFSTPGFEYTPEFTHNRYWFKKYGSKPTDVKQDDNSTLSALSRFIPQNWLSAILQTGVNVYQNKKNIDFQRETNAQNERLVKEENQAAVREADKAYQRSLPTTQVSNMVNAGMSRAGAINALNGGGSYTPAPVNSAQADSPQVDFSGVLGAVSAMMTNKLQYAQLKQQNKQFEKTLELDKQKHQLEQRKWDEESDTRKVVYNNLINQGNLLTEQLKKLGFETTIAETNANLAKSLSDKQISLSDAEFYVKKLNLENEKALAELRSKAINKLDDDEVVNTLKNVIQRQSIESTLEWFINISKEKGHDTAMKFLEEAFKQGLERGAPLTASVL